MEETSKEFRGWYRITLSQEDVLADQHLRLIRGFIAAYIGTPDRRGASLWSARWTGSVVGNPVRGDESAVYYLSPTAVRIAHHLIHGFNASPVGEPDTNQINFLAGNPSLEVFGTRFAATISAWERETSGALLCRKP